MRNTFILHLLYYLRASSFWKWVKRRRKLRNMLSMEGIDDFIDHHYGKDCPDREGLRREIYSVAKKHHLQDWEFLCYGLRGKDDDYIHSFVSDIEWKAFVSRLNQYQNINRFKDKYLCYETFKPYYMRDCAPLYATEQNFTPEILADKGMQPLLAFLRKHSRFIIKPLCGTYGKRIQLVDVAEIAGGSVPADDDLAGWSRVLNALKDSYSTIHPRGSILEEIIVQVPELARLHSASLNTVRIATVNFGDRVKLLPPCFRMGKGGIIVDNASSGGIKAFVDLDTGKLTRVTDKQGNLYEEHPDTHIPLIGFQIPKWQECKEFAKKLAMVIPSNRYTGWDVALTPKGWVMVEGNSSGELIWQFAGQRGWREGYEALCREVGLK